MDLESVRSLPGSPGLCLRLLEHFAPTAVGSNPLTHPETVAQHINGKTKRGENKWKSRLVECLTSFCRNSFWNGRCRVL